MCVLCLMHAYATPTECWAFDNLPRSTHAWPPTVRLAYPALQVALVALEAELLSQHHTSAQVHDDLQRAQQQVLALQGELAEAVRGRCVRAAAGSPRCNPHMACDGQPF